MEKWHTRDVPSILKALGSRESGLKQEDAESKLSFYGKNVLVSRKRKTIFSMILSQFKSILVLLLAFAAIVSLIVKSALDAMVILIILVINAFLGFNQEYKAEKAIESLKRYLVSTVRVVRDGKEDAIPADKLVPGDIVILEAGERIPADVRLINVINFKTDEASLTGESVSVSKTVNVMLDVPIYERKNMAFAGTLAASGRATGVVVATGMKTEFGKIAASLQEVEEPTPLQVKLDRFGGNLGLAIIGIALVLFIFGIFRGLPITQMLLTSISLAVAAVPEGLPAAISLTLAIGTQNLAKRNAVIRRLGAAEAAGSVDVICADKTGTMTSNEMTVQKIYLETQIVEVTGVGFKVGGEFLSEGRKINPKEDKHLLQLLKIAKLCNNAVLSDDKIIGDPTEGALVVLAAKAGLKDIDKRLDEIPFSSERKMMTTIHSVANQMLVYSKGAPEVILDRCAYDSFGRKMTMAKKEKLLAVTQEFASDGLRVLAFAYRKLEKNYKLENVEENLVFVGLVGMIDPPRKETKEAIRICQGAGIRIVMITGDHKLTAEAVAKEVGIASKIATGMEIDKLDDKELGVLLEKVSIFARVSPQHKLRIVGALKKKGLIVAVTGDGINDAPALKKADIGISMGIKGTDVAKEASDMVLLDDNFSTIVSSVEEGRGIYDNIKKFVRYLLAANFGEVPIIALALLAGFPLPLLPLHILWLNLVTDGLPALALSVDPKEKDIMSRKPSRGFLKNSIAFILVAGFISTVATLGIFLHSLPSGLEKARTMAFTTIVTFELLLVFNARSEKKSIFKNNPLSNKMLILAILSSVALQLLVIYLPTLQPVFDTVSLSLNDWLLIVLFASPALLVLPEVFIKR